MTVFYCLIFFSLTWFILTGVFKYSNNPKYFLYLVPVLIIFGVFAGYVLQLLKLDEFFLWYVVLLMITMAATYRNKEKEITLVKGPAGYEKSNWLTISLKSSLKYFTLSSLIYLASFVGGYLYFYNEL